MSFVYLGTSTFAAAVLRGVAERGHAPGLIVTPPDRPRGRGRHRGSPPVAEAARELGIELVQAESVNDPAAQERIRAAHPRLGLVCAFGQLIREPLLSAPGLLNVHPSLLPRWRGAAPIERAIDAGDAATGVTIMRVTEGLDSGPITLREAVAIGADDYGALAARLERVAVALAVQALDLHGAGALEWTEQDDAEATYAEKIRPEERRLDLGRSAAELARRVRALTPHIGAYLELEGGGRLGVRAATAEQGRLARSEVVTGEALRVGCAAGVLRLDVVQPAGGRPMAAEAFLRGHPAPRPG